MHVSCPVTVRLPETALRAEACFVDQEFQGIRDEIACSTSATPAVCGRSAASVSADARVHRPGACERYALRATRIRQKTVACTGGGKGPPTPLEAHGLIIVHTRFA